MGGREHPGAMRAAVYQRHLSTMGGGERYALDVARWLRDRGAEVDVLAPASPPLSEVGARLGVNLDGIRLVDVDSEDPCTDAGIRSVRYDAFVNASFGSEATNGAPAGVYVVHFPTRREHDELARAQAQGSRGRPAHATAFAMSGGLRDPARGWWTTGHGWIDLVIGGRAGWTLEMVLSPRHRGWRGGARVVELRLDGQVVRRVRVTPHAPRRVSVSIPSAQAHAKYTLEVVSEARHDEAVGVPLGVHVRSLRLRAPGARAVAVRERPFLASYDHVVACSAYTSGWVRRWWEEDATVVHPAVPPPPAAAVERGRSIVVAGRFFSGGHSKRQVELVGAFRRLCERGLRGWTLHLVGGASGAGGEQYVRRVRDVAQGLPVRIEVNASREEFAHALSSASLAWQAPGWGEDPDEHPERFEHFGITAVEVMSAGAVPVALGVGGVNEVVRDGIDGVLWRDGPEEHTLRLIEDPGRLERMSRAARERAQAFSPDAFDERLEQVLGNGRLGPGRRRAA
jgi:glycosyltransferase involved in cell wall biosynthesis